METLFLLHKNKRHNYKLINKEAHTTEVYVNFYNIALPPPWKGSNSIGRLPLVVYRWYPFIHLDEELSDI